MSKHNLEMKISGPGVQINLYCIDKTTLQALKANSKSNSPKQYHEILNQKGIDGELICWGIDVFDGPRDISIEINGKSFEMAEVRNVDDEDVALDDSMGNILFYSDETVKELDGEIATDHYALVVVDRYSLATLNAGFETDGPIDINNLRLELKDLDTASDFSGATWRLGLADDLEKDVQSISYNGLTCDCEFQCANFDSQDIYLVERGSHGDWQVSKDSEALFAAH